MKDQLDSLPDAQLAEVFELEVVGNHPGDMKSAKAGDEDWHQLMNLPYATSADAVLPHVGKFLASALFSQRQTFWMHMRRRTQDGRSWVCLEDSLGMDIRADLLARQFCIALIRAARAQKGQP